MPLSPVLMPTRKRPPESSLRVLLAPAVMVGCRDTGLVMKLPMLQWLVLSASSVSATY